MKLGKAIPLDAYIGPWWLREVEVEAAMIFRHPAYEGGKVVSPVHRPPLPPGKASVTHFC
jgi:hypothetical protein